MMDQAENTPELYFIIYNSYNYSKDINIEYSLRNDHTFGFYQFSNLIKKNFDKWISWKHLALAYIFSNETGLFRINSDHGNLKRYFSGNIEEIKNLTDLQNLKHYNYYINEGVFYTNKNYFFLLVNSINQDIYIEISKIIIEEKGKELNELNFTYFKISKGNSLTFTSNNNNNHYVIKLVSDNNGTVIINNNIYFFEEQKMEIITLKEDELFKITSIDNNFTFALKLKIPEDNIEFSEIGGKYILSKDKYYKFVVYHINAYEYSAIYFNVNIENDKYEMGWSYELGFKDINEIEKRDIPLTFGKLDLYEYNKTVDNKQCYLVFYFENITYYNTTIETKYYKPLLGEEDTFFQINGTYMKFSYENEKVRYLIIPYSDCRICKINRNEHHCQSSNQLFSFESTNEFGNTIEIDTRNEIVYVNYHKYHETDNFHYYNQECRDYFWIDDINENFLTFNFSNLFSDAPEINYTLVITPFIYYRYLHPDYSFFVNFYLNNVTSGEDLLVYRFSVKDMVIVDKDPSICATNNSIQLPSPDANFFRKEKTKYMFKLMGVTGPVYKDVKFYYPFYIDIYLCFNTCLTCDYRGNEEAQNCTSCYNDSLLQEDLGNCVNSCSIGYYREEKFCKKCSDNCETCSNFTQNGNNYCLSCNKKSKYHYLLNASNYGSNCVESCPNHTILDEDNYICIDNQNNKKNKDQKNNLKFYIIIPIVSTLLIAIIVIIILIARKKKIKKEKERKIIDDINAGLVPND